MTEEIKHLRALIESGDRDNIYLAAALACTLEKSTTGEESAKWRAYRKWALGRLKSGLVWGKEFGEEEKLNSCKNPKTWFYVGDWMYMGVNLKKSFWVLSAMEKGFVLWYEPLHADPEAGEAPGKEVEV